MAAPDIGATLFLAQNDPAAALDALVAEVRRLRKIEGAAGAVLKNQRLEVGQRACEFTIPCPQYCTDRDGWCHWCDLVAALEGSAVSTPAERSRAYRDRKRGGPPREPKPHGTVAAYRRHERHGEPPCEACKQAHADYQRELYRKRKERR